MTVAVGQPVKNFCLPATGEQTICLDDLKGQHVVLYFYPKDNTPGCTQEGQDFRDQHAAFTQSNAVILGVSRDSVKKHEGFKAKQSFPFELLADVDETLCAQFDVMKEKSMFGKKYMGVDRSTFIIDKEGVLRHEWRGVKVKGHVDEVLEAVRSL